MKITFFAAKSYDRESFNNIREDYPELELEYWETELSPKTAVYVTDSEAVCAFVSSLVAACAKGEYHCKCKQQGDEFFHCFSSKKFLMTIY